MPVGTRTPTPIRLCSVSGCHRPAAPSRTICHTHKKQRDKIRDPIATAYRTLKNNARRRHKTFTISKEEFRQWYIKNNLGVVRGRKHGQYSIDRVQNLGGYSIDNIALVTVEFNAKKGTK